tara:strand:- start:1709 stop:2095 length:387 start_codon:yes stop_codon:yes gene_type:complete
MILFLDKVFYFELSNTHGFADSQTYIWVLTQSLSPLLIVVGSIFKPYKSAYLIPVYFYTIQLYWVFDTSLKIDDALLHLYALGVVFFTAITAYFINKYFRKAMRDRADKITLLEEMLDLNRFIKDKKN